MASQTINHHENDRSALNTYNKNEEMAASSKLSSPSQRLLRKREAARIRQKRCRERKRLRQEINRVEEERRVIEARRRRMMILLNNAGEEKLQMIPPALVLAQQEQRLEERMAIEWNSNIKRTKMFHNRENAVMMVPSLNTTRSRMATTGETPSSFSPCCWTSPPPPFLDHDAEQSRSCAFPTSSLVSTGGGAREQAEGSRPFSTRTRSAFTTTALNSDKVSRRHTEDKYHSSTLFSSFLVSRWGSSNCFHSKPPPSKSVYPWYSTSTTGGSSCKPPVLQMRESSCSAFFSPSSLATSFDEESQTPQLTTSPPVSPSGGEGEEELNCSMKVTTTNSSHFDHQINYHGSTQKMLPNHNPMTKKWENCQRSPHDLLHFPQPSFATTPMPKKKNVLPPAARSIERTNLELSVIDAMLSLKSGSSHT